MADYVGFCPKCSSVDKASRGWVRERISRTALGHREARCDHAWHHEEAPPTGRPVEPEG